MDVVIIGAGRAGSALAYLLQKNGYNIKAVSSRSQESLIRAKKYIESHFILDNDAAARKGDLVIISVNDDNIASVCAELAAKDSFKKKAIVIHLSGALGLDVLEPARERSCLVGSLHPIQTLSDVDNAISNLPGSSFGITAEGKALEVLIEIVDKIKGKVVIVKDEKKALYHASACIASNYLVAISYAAAELYNISTSQNISNFEDFIPLVEGTVSNLARRGPVQALTGPLARGDINTIRQHLAAIKENAPEWLDFYKNLGLATCKIVEKRNDISNQRLIEMQELLRKEN